MLIFSLGSITVSGAILPLPITDAHKTTGGFVLTLSPTSISVPQGANGTTTVTILSTQGFSGTIFLTGQANSTSLTVAFNPASVTLSTGGTGRTTASVKASKNAPMGTYNVILTGTSLNGKRIFSSSALLTFTVDSQADFGVYANPSSLIVTAGFSNTTSVVVSSKSGFSGTVSLFATVPFGFVGVMGGQNPISLTAGSTAYSSLQVTTSLFTGVGKYNITITGVSGSVTHSCVLTISVVDPAPESLTMTGASLLSPTSISLSLHNNGNTPVALTSYSVTDISTDSWTLANWTGGTILAGSTGQPTIFIGTSCAGCTYSGVPFAFQQFVTGHTYTITVTTKLNNQFTFTVLVA